MKKLILAILSIYLVAWMFHAWPDTWYAWATCISYLTAVVCALSIQTHAIEPSIKEQIAQWRKCAEDLAACLSIYTEHHGIKPNDNSALAKFNELKGEK